MLTFWLYMLTICCVCTASTDWSLSLVHRYSTGCKVATEMRAHIGLTDCSCPNDYLFVVVTIWMASARVEIITTANEWL